MKEEPGEGGALRRLARTSARYRTARSAGEFFARFVRLAAPGLVGILCLVFLSKLLWPSLFHVVWLAPAWAAALAVYLLRRRPLWRLPAWRANAVTDLQSGNRGVYMSLREADGPGWADCLGGDDLRLEARTPRIAMMTGGVLAAMLVAVALLPDLRPPQRKVPVVTPVRDVAELVRILEAAELADPDYLEQTKELIEKLNERRQEAGKMDADDWQALDRCKEDLKRQTLESFRKLDAAQQAAAALKQQLARKQGLGRSDASRLAEMLKQTDAKSLKEMLEQKRTLQRLSKEQRDRLGKLSKRLSDDMLRDLLDTCRKGMKSGKFDLSPSELKELAELVELIEAQLVKAGEECEGALKGLGLTPADLAALGLLPGAAGGGPPGRGGITRGPGPAPLQHVGKTDPKFGKFKAKSFSGNEGDPTEDVGYLITPPGADDVDPKGVVAPGPVRRFRTGDQRLTWKTRLLPRHNDVLKRYFKSDEEGDP